VLINDSVNVVMPSNSSSTQRDFTQFFKLKAAPFFKSNCAGANCNFHRIKPRIKRAAQTNCMIYPRGPFFIRQQQTCQKFLNFKELGVKKEITI